jgi:hypothetical protein
VVEIKYAYIICLWKPQRRVCGKLTHEHNVKLIVSEIACEGREWMKQSINQYGWALGTICESCCEHGNKPLDSLKEGNVLTC